MAVLSLILAIVGAVVVLLGLIPSIGFFNWIGGIVALIGLVLGIVGAGQGEKRTLAVVGLIVSAVFVVIAVLRLVGLF
jgi:uncharacterized membrane protein